MGEILGRHGIAGEDGLGDMLKGIERRLDEARSMVVQLGYCPGHLEATEFRDYLTG